MKASNSSFAVALAACVLALGCSGNDGVATGSQGGANGVGGAATLGGATTVDGAATGGAKASGGSSTGGALQTGGSSASGGQGGTLLKGLNLSSAEWGTNLPGTYGTDYTYPTHAEIDRYAGLKMTVFRIPFQWERMQRSLNGSIDATELGRLDDIVNYATGKGARVIIDVHNYAQYNGSIIGSGTVTSTNLADFWGKMAAHYASNSLVIFGVMNEPHDIDVNTWLGAANSSIAAIRAAGATNLILVPGTNWTGAAGWTTSNTAMIGVVDSGNNYAYEAHQYLDSDSSGSHTTCVSTTIGTERITGFMSWLESHGKKGFLGEFGGGAVSNTKEQDQTCATALDSMLSLMESRSDLWVGWTYWAGGPWWQNGFSFSIADDATPWQLTLLEAHL